MASAALTRRARRR